ncbi:hypothetical protein, partial [Sandarakinorhabdus rubra]|uniref:hypothetical protein n=1 Tax=Sandarakinorhabdus rubra TaxID=2672568 RepID=UPI0013DAEC42
DDLALVLIACWQARGVRFTVEQLRARIGSATGKAALLALAGAVEDADGEGQEIVVEIGWEAGRPLSPAFPLLQRDLARGLPLLLITRDGRALLLQGLVGSMVTVRDPQGGGTVTLDWREAVLIGRPVIAGA